MQKRGAVELSMSTIVVLVLAMTMLIMGIVLIRGIFKGATENVAAIDDKVKSEINKLFVGEEAKQLVIYPANRNINLKQGDLAGFAFSIMNTESAPATFSYFVEIVSVASLCGSSWDTTKVLNLIQLGQQGTGINLASGKTMADPELVSFNIPTDMPIKCSFRVRVNVCKDVSPCTATSVWAQASADVTINLK